MAVLDLDPVPTLLSRIRAELAASFDARRPIRVSRAPGRLDVMGGIADYTGSLVCEMPLGVGTAVALQERDDRRISVFSFNLLDEHVPFMSGVSLEAMAETSADLLWWDFRKPGRKWAAYVLGCLFVLHEKGYVNLADPRHRGLNLAIYSTIPIGGGVSSSAALEVATMVNLVDHFGATTLRQDGMKLAALCQEVENRIVGAPCGIMDQVTCHLGEAGKFMRLLCRPHELLPPLPPPAGVKVVGIYTGVRHNVAGDAYGRTRAAAFMGQRMIVEHMRRLGEQAGRTMTSDPTGGYLANLAPADYKALFRPTLPETMTGREFLDRFETHNDSATTIAPAETYPIQRACDHHVLEAQRVRRFVGFLEDLLQQPRHGVMQAESPKETAARQKALRSAGHLMYASHRSYTENAGLGHAAADVLVELVKQHEPAGLYGARITGGGCGGTVAVLAETSDRADEAIGAILEAYQERTGHRPTLLDSTSPGAAHIKSEVV